MVVIRPNDPGIILATSIDGDDRLWFFERDNAGNLATKLGSIDLIRDYILPNGLNVTFGTTVPQASEGKVKDVFFNVETGQIYQKEASTGWTLKTNLITELELVAALTNFVTSTQLSSTLSSYVLSSSLPESIDDRVAALLQAGANISLTYNDASGQLTVSVTGLPEVIDDRVAALLQAGNGIALTYDDNTNTLEIEATATGSGHTIQGGSITYPQRSILALQGFTIIDDAPGDRTVVQVNGSGSGTPFAESSDAAVLLAKNTGLISNTTSARQEINLDPDALIGDICAVQGKGSGGFKISATNSTIVLPNGLMDSFLRNKTTHRYVSVYLIKIKATEWAVTKTSELSGLEVVAGGAPVITSSASAKAMEQESFNYQIVASGNPTSYAATGLPDGLTFDTNTGLISGSPNAGTLGSFSVMLEATNAQGTGSSFLVLKVGKYLLNSQMGALPILDAAGHIFVGSGSGMSVDTTNFVDGPSSIAFSGSGSQRTTLLLPAEALTGNFLLSCQVRPTTVAEDLEILAITKAIGSNDANSYQFIAEVNSNGIIRFLLRNATGTVNFDLYSPSNTLVANQFQLLEFEVVETNAFVKRNGVQVANVSITGNRSFTAEKLIIGELSFPSVERKFKGNIDSIKLIKY